MRYEYTTPEVLDDDAAFRRHVRRMADACLRMHLPAAALAVFGRVTGKKRSANLAAKLLCLSRDPRTSFKDATLQWALNYGSPALLRRMIKASSGIDTQRWELSLLRDIDPALLLPREHESPDYQVFDTSDSRPSNALVCFTGYGMKLGIPVQLFHCAVVGSFGRLIYLRDRRKECFASGVPGLGANLTEIVSSLRDRIPATCGIAVLGTSAGGIAAARIANDLNAGRLALFSPPLLTGKKETVHEGGLDNIARTRIFFGGRHDKDRRRAAEWKTVAASGDIEMLDTDSHGTLRHLAATGRLETLVDWLATAPQTNPPVRTDAP